MGAMGGDGGDERDGAISDALGVYRPTAEAGRASSMSMMGISETIG
jgi:hypothetical protein